MAQPLELREHALQCLLETEPVAKTEAIAALANAFAAGDWTVDAGAALRVSRQFPVARRSRCWWRRGWSDAVR